MKWTIKPQHLSVLKYCVSVANGIPQTCYLILFEVSQLYLLSKFNKTNIFEELIIKLCTKKL